MQGAALCSLILASFWFKAAGETNDIVCKLENNIEGHICYTTENSMSMVTFKPTSVAVTMNKNEFLVWVEVLKMYYQQPTVNRHIFGYQYNLDFKTSDQQRLLGNVSFIFYSDISTMVVQGSCCLFWFDSFFECLYGIVGKMFQQRPEEWKIKAAQERIASRLAEEVQADFEEHEPSCKPQTTEVCPEAEVENSSIYVLAKPSQRGIGENTGEGSSQVENSKPKKGTTRRPKQTESRDQNRSIGPVSTRTPQEGIPVVAETTNRPNIPPPSFPPEVEQSVTEAPTRRHSTIRPPPLANIPRRPKARGNQELEIEKDNPAGDRDSDWYKDEDEDHDEDDDEDDGDKEDFGPADGKPATSSTLGFSTTPLAPGSITSKPKRGKPVTYMDVGVRGVQKVDTGSSNPRMTSPTAYVILTSVVFARLFLT